LRRGCAVDLVGKLAGILRFKSDMYPRRLACNDQRTRPDDVLQAHVTLCERSLTIVCCQGVLESRSSHLEISDPRQYRQTLNHMLREKEFRSREDRGEPLLQQT